MGYTSSSATSPDHTSSLCSPHPPPSSSPQDPHTHTTKRLRTSELSSSHSPKATLSTSSETIISMPVSDTSLDPRPSSSPCSAVELGIRLPNGVRLQKRFPLTAKLKHVMLYLRQEGQLLQGIGYYELSTNEVPRRVLGDLSLTLQQVGLTCNTLLYLTEK